MTTVVERMFCVNNEEERSVSGLEFPVFHRI